MKGHLDTYRLVDDIWTFLVRDVNVKLDNQSNVKAERIQIVSCKTKSTGE